MASIERAGWIVILQCKTGHRFKGGGIQINVDGHAVVPVPEICPECVGDAREPTRRELWKMKRDLRKI